MFCFKFFNIFAAENKYNKNHIPMTTRSMISFDWALKRLLRNKANFGVLEGFLSELLYQKIIITSIVESESNQKTKDDKFNRVDLLVENHKHELIIIELQFYNFGDYFLRMLYGVSKTIAEYICLGDDYQKIRKVYSINIVYFDLGTGSDYIYHGFTHFKGLHTHQELELSPKEKEVYKNNYPGDLYPEYYILKLTNFNDVAKNTLDEWIYYLKNNKIRDDFTAQGLDQARKLLVFDNLTDSEKWQYENELKTIGIQSNEIKTAFTDGEFKGRVEGLEKGEAIGLEKGEAKLKADKEKTVINAFKKGMSIPDIAEITTLTVEQVAEILKQHNLL
jgi:predicted transposase/invertase (TIGR01784 family)